MKHVKTWVIPDCPLCGHELRGYWKIDDNDGVVDGWWSCTECGYESEHFHKKPYNTIEETEVTEHDR